MRINRGIGFMVVAVIFIAIAVYYATRRDGGGSAVWIALGAAIIALGATQSKKRGDDPDAR